MLLFHAVTTYHLLLLTEYKIKYHRSEKAVLLIPDTLIQKFPQYDNLKKYFEEILLFELGKPGFGDKLIKEATSAYFETILQGFNIADFDEIYVEGAQFYFGIYLASNDIPFTFFEEAAGMLSRPDVLMEIEGKYPPKREFNCQNGLYDGSCSCIKKIVCNKNAQCREMGIVEHFDVVQELLNFPEVDREWIKKIFTNIEEIDIKQNAVLFLTQHFANLQILSFEQQILIYQMVFDYFFEGKDIVIKPHPNDIMYYRKLFPRYKVIRETFPSELLPIMFTNKPDMIATISSTAISNLQLYFSKSFCLGTQYEKKFTDTHKYYTAVQMIGEMKYGRGQVSMIGANNTLIDALLDLEQEKAGLITPIFAGKKCYIVDDIQLCSEETEESVIRRMEQLEEQDTIIFINSKTDYCFYDFFHKALWNDIVPVCINKRRTRDEDFYADVKQEIIYVYSKNEEIRNMAENFEMNKSLPNTGMEIEVSHLSSEERRIKVLEGLLGATEKRLLHYIQIVDKDKTV